jgi:hypothetical protein
MDLSGSDREIDALEDRLVLDAGVQVNDLEEGIGVGANHG